MLVSMGRPFSIAAAEQPEPSCRVTGKNEQTQTHNQRQQEETNIDRELGSTLCPVKFFVPISPSAVAVCACDD